MKNVWNILCSNAIIDKASNNVTLANIVEELTIQGEPGDKKSAIIFLDLISLWTRDDPIIPEDINYSKMTLLSPSGNFLGSWELEVNLSKHRNYRRIVKFRELPIPEVGDYKFLVESQSPITKEWEKAGELTLIVNFKQLDSTEEE